LSSIVTKYLFIYSNRQQISWTFRWKRFSRNCDSHTIIDFFH